VLTTVARTLKGSKVRLGAQDLFWESKGAFTGEISPVMLVDAGCTVVIIGHSERRTHFGETDQMVRRKLGAALAHQLTPIMCIGETLAEREAGKTFDVLTRQLGQGLEGYGQAEAARMIIAYEPVWAIGTGRTATPDQAQEAHAWIRRWLQERFGAQTAGSSRVLYGGSVTAANATSLFHQPDVDGGLVGGASLDADAFATIVKSALGKPAQAASPLNT
jgi:triosephosphate isomerase